MRRDCCLLVLLLMLNICVYAQVGTGLNVKNPNAYSFLHINETVGGSKVKAGLITTRYSDAEVTTANFGTLSATENGLLYYNLTNNCFSFWRQNTVSAPTGSWINICSLTPFYFIPNSSGATVNPNPIGAAAVTGTIILPITTVSNGTINAFSQVINGITFTLSATSVTPSTSSITINFTGTRASVTNIYLPIKDNNGVILCYIFVPVS